MLVWEFEFLFACGRTGISLTWMVYLCSHACWMTFSFFSPISIVLYYSSASHSLLLVQFLPSTRTEDATLRIGEPCRIQPRKKKKMKKMFSEMQTVNRIFCVDIHEEKSREETTP